jgi:hypothetical protein
MYPNLKWEAAYEVPVQSRCTNLHFFLEHQALWKKDLCHTIWYSHLAHAANLPLEWMLTESVKIYSPSQQFLRMIIIGLKLLINSPIFAAS